jgi:hypothetical protein
VGGDRERVRRHQGERHQRDRPHPGEEGRGRAEHARPEQLTVPQQERPERGERIAEHIRGAELAPPRRGELPQHGPGLVPQRVAAYDRVDGRGRRERAQQHAARERARHPEQVQLEQAQTDLARPGVPADEPARQPFTEPIITPFSKYRCRNG